MFTFKGIADKFKSGFSRMHGRTDFLEAVCAANALVAAADGEITDTEIKVSIAAVSANPTLAAGFKAAQIQRTMDTMLKRAQSGRSGRMGLFKEIDDVAAQPEMGEMVYLAALDCAEADGNVADKEKAVLAEIAKRVGIDPKKYANI